MKTLLSITKFHFERSTISSKQQITHNIITNKHMQNEARLSLRSQTNLNMSFFRRLIYGSYFELMDFSVFRLIQLLYGQLFFTNNFFVNEHNYFLNVFQM